MMRVGDRQRSQHSAAADDETRVGFLLDPCSEKRIRLARGPDAAVGLRRDQRVRQAQVGLAQLFVEPHRVGAETRVRRCEERGPGRIGAHRAIQVVRHAAHHAVRVLRPRRVIARLTLASSSVVFGNRNERATLCPLDGESNRQSAARRHWRS